MNFSRVELENYAKENKIEWREDSSNASTKYLRNKLRHEVIPVLKELNPQILQNFKLTQSHLQDSKNIIKDRVEEVLEKVVTKISENEIHFSIGKIKNLSNPKAYLFEILKEYQFTEWQDVEDLLEAQTGKQVFSNTYRLLKNRDVLILTEIHKKQAEIEEVSFSENDSQVEIPLGTLTITETQNFKEQNNLTIYVDKDLLKYPLTVRKWEKGDYFYPFGMESKKKLSKFFKDEKLSMLEKENVWLVCSNEDVVWIINYRADNRFKITEKTKNILKISLKNET